MTEPIDELSALEHRGWNALCTGAGGDFYGELMTEDGVMVLAHGFAMTREEVIQSLDGAPPWDRYEIEDERVIVLADGAACLVYTGRGHRTGEPPFVALMASTYVRRDGRWRLAVYQQTPIPAQDDEPNPR